MFPIAASIPYFICFYFISLLLIAPYRKFKSKNQFLFLLFLASLIVFMSYKGEHSDWRTYREFVEICNGIGCTYFEPLYDLLTFIASKTVGFSLIPIFSLLLLFSVFLKLKEHVNNKSQYFVVVLSIFLAYLPLYYGALRQSIAFSFLLLGLLYFMRKKYFEGLLLAVISTGFHLSSIVILFVFIVYFFLWKISSSCFKFFLLLVAISYFGGLFLMSLLVSELAKMARFNVGTLGAVVDNTKSLVVPIERLIVLGMGLHVLYYFRNSKLFSFLSILSISGAIFYLIVYSYSLNTAGRVVAFFRLADVFTIYYFFKIALSRDRSNINTEKINKIALLGILTYSLIKYYFTIVSVGFFV